MIVGIPVSMSKTQYFLNQAYVDYIIEAGHAPFAIYPNGNEGAYAAAVDQIDALLMPGGIDVDPIYYGIDNFSSFSTDPYKDEFERTIFHLVRKCNKPIFGVCRGFQLIILEYMLADENLHKNMYFSQHVHHHAQTSPDGQGLARHQHVHFVEYSPAVLYGQPNHDSDYFTTMPVNSMHHQALISDVPSAGTTLNIDGFRLAAFTSRGIKQSKGKQKAVCEAYRIVNWGSPILAVQWHPEELRDYDLLNNFLHNQPQPHEKVMTNVS